VIRSFSNSKEIFHLLLTSELSKKMKNIFMIKFTSLRSQFTQSENIESSGDKRKIIFFAEFYRGKSFSRKRISSLQALNVNSIREFQAKGKECSFFALRFIIMIAII
jgi:hypothetical protein